MQLHGHRAMRLQCEAAMAMALERRRQAVAAGTAAADLPRVFGGPCGLPGRRWWHAFRLRHNLIIRTAKRRTNRPPTREDLDRFFARLRERMVALSIGSDRVHNADETGFALFDRHGKVVTHPSCVDKGQAPQLHKEYRDHLTFMPTICAAGNRIADVWLYKGKTHEPTARVLAGVSAISTYAMPTGTWPPPATAHRNRCDSLDSLLGC